MSDQRVRFRVCRCGSETANNGGVCKPCLDRRDDRVRLSGRMSGHSLIRAKGRRRRGYLGPRKA